MNEIEKRRRNHCRAEEDDRKAILLELKKLSYRNGVLKVKVFHRFNECNLLGLDNLGAINDFKIVSNNITSRINIERVENIGNGRYNIKISDFNSKDLSRPSNPFKIYLSVFLFDNEMQYFSFPLNFRGKRTNK